MNDERQRYNERTREILEDIDAEMIAGNPGRVVHFLKTWPQQFQAAFDGFKTFEIRKNDRGFRNGDVLCLREWCPNAREYSGRSLTVRVTWIENGPEWGLADGLCVMAVRR